MTKSVFITGASRGIGAQTARLFAQEGYAVGINYYKSRADAENLAAALSDTGAKVRLFCADVSDPAQISAAISDAEKTFSGLDVLVNNAGIARPLELLTDLTPEDWTRIWNVNVTGMINACQAVLPGMVRRQSGRIINLSSIWGITGASCEVAYSTTKAAIIGLTKALAKEVGPSHITVNCVAPGVIETEMNAALDPQALDALCEETPLETLGTAQDVAESILFLASERARFITGQVLSPNGGIVI